MKIEDECLFVDSFPVHNHHLYSDDPRVLHGVNTE
jgi:hypothetical protein